MAPLAYSLDSTQDYEPWECPVVGNTNSRLYHVQGGKYYTVMLVKNKDKENRVCFQAEHNARQAGYRQSKR